MRACSKWGVFQSLDLPAPQAAWVLGSTQVPSGTVTTLGSKVFLSITMTVLDLLTGSAGADLPGKGMTLRGEAA